MACTELPRFHCFTPFFSQVDDEHPTHGLLLFGFQANIAPSNIQPTLEKEILPTLLIAVSPFVYKLVQSRYFRATQSACPIRYRPAMYIYSGEVRVGYSCF